jgi:hypothetical protein
MNGIVVVSVISMNGIVVVSVISMNGIVVVSVIILQTVGLQHIIILHLIVQLVQCMISSYYPLSMFSRNDERPEVMLCATCCFMRLVARMTTVLRVQNDMVF